MWHLCLFSGTKRYSEYSCGFQAPSSNSGSANQQLLPAVGLCYRACRKGNGFTPKYRYTHTPTYSHRHPSLGFGTPNQSHPYSCRHFYTHIHTCCAGLPVEEGKVCLSSKYVTVQCSRTVTIMEIRKHRKVGYRKGPGQHRTPKPSYSVSDFLQL